MSEIRKRIHSGGDLGFFDRIAGEYLHGNLVPADEHETAVAEAVRAERERGARIAESYSARAFTRRQILKPQTIAAAIREKDKP